MDKSFGKYFENELPVTEIRKLLEGGVDKDIMEGLKYLIAVCCARKDSLG